MNWDMAIHTGTYSYKIHTYTHAYRYIHTGTYIHTYIHTYSSSTRVRTRVRAHTRVPMGTYYLTYTTVPLAPFVPVHRYSRGAGEGMIPDTKVQASSENSNSWNSGNKNKNKTIQKTKLKHKRDPSTAVLAFRCFVRLGKVAPSNTDLNFLGTRCPFRDFDP